MTTRIESDQVTLMTVFRVFVLPVVVPFVEVTLLTNRIRMEFPQCLLVSGDTVTAKGTRCDYRPKQFTDDGEVSSTPITSHPMIAFVSDILVLGRGGGSRNQFLWILRILHQPVQTEIGSPLHQGVGCRTQVFLILGKQVTLP